MKKIFVTGGCRSGKSRFALDYANRHFSRKLYLATCEVFDEEMARRVESHKLARGPEWQTIEEPVDVVKMMKSHGGHTEVILLDCVTLWLTNLLIKWDDDQRIIAEVDSMIDTLRQTGASSILVSNEVGMGIVPADPLSRRFRDLAGTANQRIAEMADEVVFVVSGIPFYLKGNP